MTLKTFLDVLSKKSILNRDNHSPSINNDKQKKDKNEHQTKQVLGSIIEAINLKIIENFGVQENDEIRVTLDAILQAIATVKQNFQKMLIKYKNISPSQAGQSEIKNIQQINNDFFVKIPVLAREVYNQKNKKTL